MNIKSKRKNIIIILILSGILYLFVNYADIAARLGQGYMSVGTVDTHQLEQLIGGLEEAQDKPVVLFNDHALAYDALTGRYFATQDMESGMWDGVFTCGSGELYWQRDSYFTRHADAIAEGHEFALYCVNRQEECYSIYQIVFTGMPVMMVTTESGADIGDDVQKAQVQVCDMKFSGKEYQSTNCEVSVRGQSSRRFPKQGYKLVLDRKMSLLGMRRDEDWILTALYDDDGLIHNKMSYDVWKNIASDNSDAKDDGTSMEYVELFNNNVYMGVYGLTERIDAKELSLDKNDILYKCRGFAAPDETVAGDFGLSVGYDIKYPKEYDEDVWVPLKDYLDIFAAKEIEDYDKAKALLNMENAIDFNIFIILTRACDNYARKNTYFVAEYDKLTWGGV